MSRSKGGVSYCNICGKECDAKQLVPFDFTRPGQLLGNSFPHKFSGKICPACYARETATGMAQEKGESEKDETEE